jgi:tetratricopeptide (TPR) repeat protein
MTKRQLSAFGVLAILAAGCGQPAAVVRSPQPVAPMGAPSAPGTSREALAETIRAAQAKLKLEPTNAQAAVRLADALMRQARVLGNPGLVIQAERTLRSVLLADVDRYDARRMLATVLLSQHRFREAIREAERCRQMKPNDTWTDGVIGDAHLELGEYEEAFAAFGRMEHRRPDAASYARVAYARELQGDLDAAIRLMTMALDATGPNDPESQAWHHAQLGHLQMARGRLTDAAREFDHAQFIFADHPFALEGLARVADAQGRHADALTMAERVNALAPTPAMLAFAADQLRALGRASEAARRDQLAEAAWRTDAPDPARLALFLAVRGEKIDEAVRLAETAARDRDDIFTNDALAWSYFRAGRIEEAARASARALRTGTQDRELRQRARTIASAAAVAHQAAR